MFKEELYLHPLHHNVESALKELLKFEEEILLYYREFDEKFRRPDLLGKTVMVTDKQFSEVYAITAELASIMGIPAPTVYVYEDFYYGVECKGIDNPWIEISAKTITDLSLNEVRFLLAREFCRLKHGSVYLDTLANQTMKIVQESSMLPGMDMLAKTLKVKYCKWSRVSHYSADCLGYLVVKDLEACCQAVLKLVLNNLQLAKQVDIKSYIGQTEMINELDDSVSRFTKNDERIPYGPFRLKHLIAYASSRNVINQ